MTVRFIFDAKSYKDYVRQLKRIARKMKWAKSLYLNEMAFSAKEEAMIIIPRKMIIRNKSFIKRSLRVQKAKTTGNTFSIMGTISRPRYTGLKEQEFGGTKERRVIPTARTGNNIRGRMRAKARLKPSNKFKSPKDFPRTTGDKHGTQAMLQQMSRDREKDPFIIYGHPKFKPGLYKLKGRKPKQRIITLQLFDEPSVQRKPWMRPTIDRMKQRWDENMQWARIWRRVKQRS